VVQVKHKYNALMLDVFREVFNWLPLAFVLNRQVLVLHGGLFSKDGVSLDDLRKVERNRWPGPFGLRGDAFYFGEGVARQGGRACVLGREGGRVSL
jgi:serine/threonine-protein phosphatase 5